MSFGESIMPVAYFPSLPSVETIEVIFVKPEGGELSIRLLVDSGFTGDSSFVLPKDTKELAHAHAAASKVAGALHGRQNRMVVSVRIPNLSFQALAIAIVADTSDLALPPEVGGMVGLQFLRRFRRWGSEQTDKGDWRFFLATNGDGPDQST
jgi:predicted aspartyl protease